MSQRTQKVTVRENDKRGLQGVIYGRWEAFVWEVGEFDCLRKSETENEGANK